MTKEEIINRLTLLDTQAFRLRALRDKGVYMREPKEFRKELAIVYNKISLDILEKLLDLK